MVESRATSMVQAADLVDFLDMQGSFNLGYLHTHPGPEQYVPRSRYCLVDTQVSLMQFLKHLSSQATWYNNLLSLNDQSLGYC